MTGPKPKTVPSKGVSLSGKTRLTYREACALLDFALAGDGDFQAMDEDDPQYDAALHRTGRNAIQKLKTALINAGGYDEQGKLLDPFAK